jgi:hypothetical protein
MTAVKFSRADEYVAELEAQRRAWAATNGPAVARNRDRTQAILLAEYRADARRARESEERMANALSEANRHANVQGGCLCPTAHSCYRIVAGILASALRDSGLEGEETDLPPIDSPPLETE